MGNAMGCQGWSFVFAAVAVACGARTGDYDVTGLDRCGTSAACGGDLTGTWTVGTYCSDGVALSLPDFDTSLSECDAEYERAAGAATIDPIDLSVEFDGTTYRLLGTASITYSFTYTDACFRALYENSLDADHCESLTYNQYQGRIPGLTAAANT